MDVPRTIRTSWPSITESSTGRMLSTGPVRPRWTKRNTASACGPKTAGFASSSRSITRPKRRHVSRSRPTTYAIGNSLSASHEAPTHSHSASTTPRSWTGIRRPVHPGERSCQSWNSHVQLQSRAAHASRLSGAATGRHQAQSGHRQHVPALSRPSGRQGTAIGNGVFLLDRTHCSRTGIAPRRAQGGARQHRERRPPGDGGGPGQGLGLWRARTFPGKCRLGPIRSTIGSDRNLDALAGRDPSHRGHNPICARFNARPGRGHLRTSSKSRRAARLRFSCRAARDHAQFPVMLSRLTIAPSMSNSSGGIP